MVVDAVWISGQGQLLKPLQANCLVAGQITTGNQNALQGRSQISRKTQGFFLVCTADIRVDKHGARLSFGQIGRHGEAKITQPEELCWRNAVRMGRNFAVEYEDRALGKALPQMVIGPAIAQPQLQHRPGLAGYRIGNFVDAGALGLHAQDENIKSGHGGFSWQRAARDLPELSARRGHDPTVRKDAQVRCGRGTCKIYAVIPDTNAPVIVALLAVGMALSFILADRRSPTSQAQALFLAFVGISIAVDVMLVLPLRKASGVVPWEGVFVLPQVLAFVFAYEWVLRVRRTIPAGNLNTRGPDRLLRAAQGLALFYGLTALVFPELRAEHFGNLTLDPGERIHPSFWLFSVPLGLSIALGTAATLFTLNRRPDRTEIRRLVAFAISAPIMASGVVVPAHIASLATAVGLLVLLVGSVQYHVTQGQRAQFLSRFLAPQVAELVTRRGLKSATEEKTLELSVVCCDLRGFTAFSAATSSRRVIEILREYYDAVGVAAAACGGTIKDQAGDGVLILVGAPIAMADHAQRALELGRQIRTVGVALTSHWSNDEMQLGVGVGVASGFVTVGVIGGASRLEYTAVGSPVNLASRLCSEALHGEVLVDGRTMELLGADPGRNRLRTGLALQLKGFALPMQSYVLEAA